MYFVLKLYKNRLNLNNFIVLKSLYYNLLVTKTKRIIYTWNRWSNCLMDRTMEIETRAHAHMVGCIECSEQDGFRWIDRYMTEVE